MTKDQIEEIREQLQSFVRDRRTAEEKCKILSLGNDCKCPLCLIDNLVNFKLKQADVISQVCEHKYTWTGNLDATICNDCRKVLDSD